MIGMMEGDRAALWYSGLCEPQTAEDTLSSINKNLDGSSDLLAAQRSTHARDEGARDVRGKPRFPRIGG